MRQIISQKPGPLETLASLVGTIGTRLWNVFDKWTTPPPQYQHHHQTTTQPEAAPRLSYEIYRERKRSLPNKFTARDWQCALEYWGNSCAVCGRPRGFWHTISQDHWIPLTNPDCPGTLPTNMLPLCCGTDGCNNSKGKKDPYLWLQEKLGKKRAVRKLAEIEAYFEYVRELVGDYTETLIDERTCPDCDCVLEYMEDQGVFHCHNCLEDWREVEDEPEIDSSSQAA